MPVDLTHLPGGRRAFGQVTLAQRPAAEGVSGVNTGMDSPASCQSISFNEFNMQCNKNCDISEQKISTQPRKACSVCILFSRTLAVSDFLPELQPCCSKRWVLEELTTIQNRASLEFASRLKAFWPVLGPSLYLQNFTHLTKGCLYAILRAERCGSFQADSTAEAVTGELNRKAAEQSATWSENSWGHHRTLQDTHAPEIQRCRSLVRSKHMANHCKSRTLLLGWRMLPDATSNSAKFPMISLTAVSKMDWGLAGPVGREGKLQVVTICYSSIQLKKCLALESREISRVCWEGLPELFFLCAEFAPLAELFPLISQILQDERTKAEKMVQARLPVSPSFIYSFHIQFDCT